MPKRKSVKRVSRSRRNTLRRKTLRRKTLRRKSKRVNKKRSSRKMRGGAGVSLQSQKSQVVELIDYLFENNIEEKKIMDAAKRGLKGLMQLKEEEFTTPPHSRSGSDNGDVNIDGTMVMVVTELKEKDGQVKYEVEETFADDRSKRRAAVLATPSRRGKNSL